MPKDFRVRLTVAFDIDVPWPHPPQFETQASRPESVAWSITKEVFEQSFKRAVCLELVDARSREM